MDINLDQQDISFRFIFVDDPQLIPGILRRYRDGCGFQQGTQTHMPARGFSLYAHRFAHFE